MGMARIEREWPSGQTTILSTQFPLQASDQQVSPEDPGTPRVQVVLRRRNKEEEGAFFLWRENKVRGQAKKGEGTPLSSRGLSSRASHSSGTGAREPPRTLFVAFSIY